MRIRPLRSEDRDEWLRLLSGLYADVPLADHIPPVDAFLARARVDELIPTEVFVCERAEGGLAGMLELSLRTYAEGCEGETPYVESWYVDPDVRGTGVGRELMAAAEEWSREHGYRELASDTELANAGSRAAHAAVGFEEVERTVHFRKRLRESGRSNSPAAGGALKGIRKSSE